MAQRITPRATKTISLSLISKALDSSRYGCGIRRIWHEHNSKSASSERFEGSREAEKFFQDVYSLSSQNDMQRALKGRIVRVATDLAQERLLLFVQNDNTISTPFLVILAFWLTMIFAILSLLTRLNLLIAIILFICALSVSASVFLILDLDRAFSGMMQVSDAPLRNALSPNIR
jgi:hypothetical protein